VKTRTEQRTRMVEYTVNGTTRSVPETYSVEVAVAPRDLDRVALRAAVLMTTAVVLGSVIWSTVSIGSLLSASAPSWAAFLVAGVFDLAWITCLTVEWLSRYEPAKAALPRRAGWGALFLSMSAITIHGYEQGALIVGVVGALVSAIAKGMWLVLMRYTVRELLPVQQAWVDGELADVHAQKALATVQRQLMRTQDATNAERLALNASRPVETTVEVQRPSVEETATPVALPSTVVEKTATPVEVQRPAVETPVALPSTPVPVQRPAVNVETSQYMTTADVVKRAAELGMPTAESTVRSWRHNKKLPTAVEVDGALHDRDVVEVFLLEKLATRKNA